MTKRMQVYVCGRCGNMVEVLRTAGGTLVCCGQPMGLAEENTTDAAQEKHVPVIERAGGKVVVRVGSAAHPMTPEHWIELVEIVQDNTIVRRFLSPEDEPVAEFACPGGEVSARAYCNLHGLWKS